MEVKNSSTSTANRYQAFMLRMWQERSLLPADKETFRFSLEDTLTGQRIGFSDVSQLIQFLQKQMSDNTHSH